MSVEKYRNFIQGQLALSGSDFFRRQQQEYEQQQSLWKEQQRQQSLVPQPEVEDKVNLSQLFKI